MSFAWCEWLLENNLVKGRPFVIIGREQKKLSFVALLESRNFHIFFLGDGYTHGDYFGFLCKTFDARVMKRFILFLTLRFPFHRIHLNKIKSTSPLISILNTLDFHYQVIEKDSYVIPISTNFTNYLEHTLSGHTRRDLRKKLKKLNPISYRLCSGANFSRNEFSKLMHLYKERIIEKSGKFSFDDHYMQQFEHYVLDSAIFLIFVVYIEDEIGAYSIGVKNGNELELIINHYNLKFFKYSLGSLAITSLIKCLLENETDIKFLNLGFAEGEYKQRLGGISNLCFCYKFNLFSNNKFIRERVRTLYCSTQVKKIRTIIRTSFNKIKEIMHETLLSIEYFQKRNAK